LILAKYQSYYPNHPKNKQFKDNNQIYSCTLPYPERIKAKHKGYAFELTRTCINIHTI